MKGKILIVDDDNNICRLIDLYLQDAGYATICCHDGSLALDLIQREVVDLVLLDLMIPTINGWEVCKLIKLEKDIPIILISARDAVEDKIAGFDSGADDYVVKPFNPQELVARVKVRLKTRSADTHTDREVLSLYNLEIDMNRYQVMLDNRLIELKPKELQMLYFLARNKNIVFTRDQLLEKLWGYTHSGDTRTVDAHIKALRDKLACPSPGWEIKTIWGVGYKMEVH